MKHRQEIIGDATLILGDCRRLGLDLHDFDAVVTDPPYGMNRANSGHAVIDRLGAIIGDDEPFDPWPFDQVEWLIFWGANHYASRLPDASRWLMWLKHDPSLFQQRSGSPFELAWTNLGGSCRAMRHIWDGSIKQGEGAGKPHVHPAEKPVEVMRWCIDLLPATAATVLDPFMGSGTTGVACANRGKPFTGVEIDLIYFDIACRRIEAAQKQGNLALVGSTS